jgi:hypothetical protein
MPTWALILFSLGNKNSKEFLGRSVIGWKKLLKETCEIIFAPLNLNVEGASNVNH